VPVGSDGRARGGMRSKQEHPIQAMGFWMFGFLCFCWLKQEEGEEEPTTVQKHSR
jgi:hypothetical protein